LPELAPLPANGDYAELRRRVRAAGLLEPQNGYYVLKLTLSLAMFAGAIALALVIEHPALLLADAVFFAFASTQMALL
jgi:hypothetical protein